MTVRQHSARILAFLLAAIVVAGCGGGRSHHPQHHSVGHTGPTIISGHACTPQNEAMQCLLPPAPVGVLRGAPAPVRQGVDFAWSCPSPSGRAFGASYLSGTSKDWTTGCLNAWHNAGAASVAVWETAGTRALNGCAAGAQDARNAAGELARLGAPAGQPFDMAIDFDANGPEVSPYFQCASRAEPGRVNAYGGYRPLLYLSQHGLVGHLNWQTYAWSGGAWLPSSIAPLEQYLNGSAVDYDRAVADNYGQWPFAAPQPKPDPYAIYPARRILLYHQRISERHTVEVWWAHHCANPVRRETCKSTRTHLRWLADRLHELAIAAGGQWGTPKPDWKPFHWGARHYRIERILTSRPRRKHR